VNYNEKIKDHLKNLNDTKKECEKLYFEMSRSYFADNQDNILEIISKENEDQESITQEVKDIYLRDKKVFNKDDLENFSNSTLIRNIGLLEKNIKKVKGSYATIEKLEKDNEKINESLNKNKEKENGFFQDIDADLVSLGSFIYEHYSNLNNEKLKDSKYIHEIKDLLSKINQIENILNIKDIQEDLTEEQDNQTKPNFFSSIINKFKLNLQQNELKKYQKELPILYRNLAKNDYVNIILDLKNYSMTLKDDSYTFIDSLLKQSEAIKDVLLLNKELDQKILKNKEDINILAEGKPLNLIKANVEKESLKLKNELRDSYLILGNKLLENIKETKDIDSFALKEFNNVSANTKEYINKVTALNNEIQLHEDKIKRFQYAKKAYELEKEIEKKNSTLIQIQKLIDEKRKEIVDLEREIDTKQKEIELSKQKAGNLEELI